MTIMTFKDAEDGAAWSLPVAKETGLKGEVSLPGDKSISHRCVLLGAIAKGETTITGLLEGEDVLRSAACMRALGAEIECDIDQGGAKTWRVFNGPINAGHEDRDANSTLYFGNAGTGVRLAMGLVAGLKIEASFDGDGSLRGRPMGRILEPLSKMGLVAMSNEGRLPVQFEGANHLNAIRYRLPVPSAQIKSAILLAGLGAKGTTIIEEPLRSRDHTENMLKSFGAKIELEPFEERGRLISLAGGQSLSGTHINVPGDPSSAAFPIAGALITPGSDILVRNVLMNEMRIGVLTTFQEMGGQIEILEPRNEAGEPVADIRVRASELHGVEIPATRAPAMIDEYPIVSVVSAFAKGETLMQGIGEMRIKESDRIAAMEEGLIANGVKVESGADWMKVTGSGEPVLGGGLAKTYHDHRIAMSFLVMGMASKAKIGVDDLSMIATSFPNFVDLMNALGARIQG